MGRGLAHPRRGLTRHTRMTLHRRLPGMSVAKMGWTMDRCRASAMNYRPARLAEAAPPLLVLIHGGGRAGGTDGPRAGGVRDEAPRSLMG